MFTEGVECNSSSKVLGVSLGGHDCAVRAVCAGMSQGSNLYTRGSRCVLGAPAPCLVLGLTGDDVQGRHYVAALSEQLQPQPCAAGASLFCLIRQLLYAPALALLGSFCVRVTVRVFRVDAV